MVYSTDRSKAVVLVLVLLFVAISTRRFVLNIALCYFVLVFFNPFSIAITSLWEGKANLGAFLAFVRFVLVCACLFLSFFSSSLCLGWAAGCDCGTPWAFLLPFFRSGNGQVRATSLPCDPSGPSSKLSVLL